MQKSFVLVLKSRAGAGAGSGKKILGAGAVAAPKQAGSETLVLCHRWSVLWGLVGMVLLLYSYRLATRHPAHWMGFGHREARLADRLR